MRSSPGGTAELREISPERLTTSDRRRFSKRPLTSPPRPHSVNQQPHHQNHSCVANLAEKISARNQNKKKTCRRHQRRDRIKPHAKRSRHLRAPHPQDD